MVRGLGFLYESQKQGWERVVAAGKRRREEGLGLSLERPG
jgi:hypothetical protein